MKHDTVRTEDLEVLMANAMKRGATSVTALKASDIPILDHLADKCREPRCSNYGLSRSCPPHVAGPAAMKADLLSYSVAVFFRIEVPSHGLYSDGQRELFHLMHEVASAIEHDALGMGYSRAKAFAGGSCKEIFCHDHLDCQYLSGQGVCRHADVARPSMSGFGVHVAGLMAKAGWAMTTTRDGEPVSSVSGLVLIG